MSARKTPTHELKWKHGNVLTLYWVSVRAFLTQLGDSCKQDTPHSPYIQDNGELMVYCFLDMPTMKQIYRAKLARLYGRNVQLFYRSMLIQKLCREGFWLLVTYILICKYESFVVTGRNNIGTVQIESQQRDHTSTTTGNCVHIQNP
jgi:hypothetical protein